MPVVLTRTLVRQHCGLWNSLHYYFKDESTEGEDMGELERDCCSWTTMVGGERWEIAYPGSNLKLSHHLDCLNREYWRVEDTAADSTQGTIEHPTFCEELKQSFVGRCGSRLLLKLLDHDRNPRFAIRTRPVWHCCYTPEEGCCQCCSEYWRRIIPVSKFDEYEIVAKIEICARHRGCCGGGLTEHAKITIVHPDGADDVDKRLLMLLAIHEDIHSALHYARPEDGEPARELNWDTEPPTLD